MSVESIDASSASQVLAWEQLGSVADPAFFQNWLQVQCAMIAGTYAGILVVRNDEGEGYSAKAMWPVSLAAADELSELAERVLEERIGLVTQLEGEARSGPGSYGIAYPVEEDGDVLAVSALAIVVDDENALQKALHCLQWGSAWIRLPELQKTSADRQGVQQRLTTGVDILAKVLAETDYSSAAMRLVTELALVFNCDRVSFGISKNGATRIEQMSHSAQFGKRMNLVRAIENAMDEGTDQRLTVVYPESSETHAGTILVAHKNLAEMAGEMNILTIPLYSQDSCLGVVLLERAPEKVFNRKEAEFCESVVALVMVALEEKRLNSRLLIIKVWDSFKKQAQKLFGPRHIGRKLTATLITAIVLFMVFAQGSYRLSADAVLETALKRVIAAPFDGYIKQANYRAGDLVKQDQILVQLDDKDLRLERLRWKSQDTQIKRQYQEAIAAHDRARINVLNAKSDQIQAELSLVEEKLRRSDLRAVFDGLIVNGDLSQRLGGTASQGEVLFEISPLNSYRINLRVKESRISEVKLGQLGTLYLSALPEQPFEFVVIKLTPIAEARQGAAYFRVEAELKNVLPEMRPGMEGIGKIQIDQRRLISIWSRELVEWLRLKLWSFWG